jgi:hypothetical protein
VARARKRWIAIRKRWMALEREIDDQRHSNNISILSCFTHVGSKVTFAYKVSYYMCFDEEIVREYLLFLSTLGRIL